jgi:hypothetical protein
MLPGRGCGGLSTTKEKEKEKEPPCETIEIQDLEYARQTRAGT